MSLCAFSLLNAIKLVYDAESKCPVFPFPDSARKVRYMCYSAPQHQQQHLKQIPPNHKKIYIIIKIKLEGPAGKRLKLWTKKILWKNTSNSVEKRRS